MPRKRLLWQLYPSYLLITLLAVFAVSWYSYQSFRSFYLASLHENLAIRAKFIEDRLREPLINRDFEAVRKFTKQLAVDAAVRVTVIGADGTVISDSHRSPEEMDNHRGRPEVVEALGGKTGYSVRFSETLRRNLMYVAYPIGGLKPFAIVRAAISTNAIDDQISTFTSSVLLGGIVVAILAALSLLAFSRRVSKPLDEIRIVAQRFAKGDFSSRLKVPDTEEIAELVESMNEMAMQLDERIRTIVEQRAEQEAVLSSMVEGVLAVDADERIININQTAARLINTDVARALGRTITEVIRNSELQRLVVETLEQFGPIERDIVIRGTGDEMFLAVHGTALKDSDGKRVGAVVVLNDVTRIQRLENMRRDFVANVSHELRTPITSIKGFVETLLDGALTSEEDARRFLQIIANHADRLNMIIEDLLSLARIEQGVEHRGIDLAEGKLLTVLQDAAQVCLPQAEVRKVIINLNCSADLRVPMNNSLLEQAVINLIENAIKYSEPGSTVDISAYEVRDEVGISVKDYGVGIAPEHHSRLFERFYRVDRGRTRTGRDSSPGGTGLGLAIVKHVAIAHRGRVNIKSTLGEGSTFSIFLPRAPRYTQSLNDGDGQFRPQPSR
ncbi:MAG: HAMP domain-containing protein [Bdellovibrionales bacterium]|nr:HAMP domain-containing protein [Bdellovibrionales bacterium]